MSGETNLSLTIRAIDKATGPLQAVSNKIARLAAPIQQLGKKLHHFGETSGLMKLGEAFKGVGEAAHHAGEKAFELGKETVIMGLEAGFVLFELVKHFAEAGDEIAKTADRLGLTVDAFSSLQGAFGRAGVSQEDFVTGMDHFSVAMGELREGDGALYKVLAKNDPALLKRLKATKNNEEAMDAMAEGTKRLMHVENRAELVKAAYGKSGKRFVDGLKDGAEGLAKQRAESLRATGDLKEFTERSVLLSETLVGVKEAFFGAGAVVANAFFPVFTELADSVKEFLIKNREGIAAWAKNAAKAFKEWVDGGGIDRLVVLFKKFAAGALDLLDTVGGLTGVLKILGLYMAGPLLLGVGQLGIALLKLVPAFWKVILAVERMVFMPMVAAIGYFVEALGAGFTAMEAFNLVLITNPIGLVIVAVTALAGLAYLVYRNWEPIKAFFESLWESIKSPLEALKTAKQFWGSALGLNVTTEDATRMEGARAARPMLGMPKDYSGQPTFGADKARAPNQSSETHLKVDINGAPPGTKVSQISSGPASVDLSVGRTMLASY